MTAHSTLSAMTPPRIIKQRDRDAIIRSLRSGVVPATGLQHIQVGRSEEIKSFVRDIDAVADGGASLRLVIGEYGAGKTFFLSLVRTMAMERGLLTMKADLSPEKRFHGSGGQARRLLSELVASLSTRTKTDGQALPMVLDRLSAKASAEGTTVRHLLEPLTQLPGGHAFAQVVDIYCRAESDGQRLAAQRWLTADYTTRTDALRDLGVREYLGDADLFPTLRLYAALAVAAGFKGLYVCVDELVNLYKITNAVSRRANYEDLLSILNATLQGNVHSLGIVLSGTPEFLTDTRRGLYSYEALRSRLAENSLAAQAGLKDYDSTVLRLSNLTPEEMYVLLKNLREVMASGTQGLRERVPDMALEAYLRHCYERIGESYFRTPRNTIKGFIDMMSLLEQYPEMDWRVIIPTMSVDVDVEPSPMAEFML
ncbi:MAG: ATP-binding protein [Bacteroidales bacterium]|nr:ATP-binding protein [Bacteroidales bacterium]MCD8393633.1 ATP-binding protein [Bacteroidales bacterium]